MEIFTSDFLAQDSKLRQEHKISYLGGSSERGPKIHPKAEFCRNFRISKVKCIFSQKNPWLLPDSASHKQQVHSRRGKQDWKRRIYGLSLFCTNDNHCNRATAAVTTTASTVTQTNHGQARPGLGPSCGLCRGEVILRGQREVFFVRQVWKRWQGLRSKIKEGLSGSDAQDNCQGAVQVRRDTSSPFP